MTSDHRSRKFLKGIEGLSKKQRTAKLARESPLYRLTVRHVQSELLQARWELKLDWKDQLDDERDGKPIWQHLIECEQGLVYRKRKCVGIVHAAWLMSEEILPIAVRLFAQFHAM